MRCYCVRFPYAPSQSQLINRGYPVLSKVRISSSFQPKLMMSATLRSIVSPSRSERFSVCAATACRSRWSRGGDCVRASTMKDKSHAHITIVTRLRFQCVS